MSGDAVWSINFDAEDLKQQIADQIEAAVTEVFELDIKPRAVELSPYKTGLNRKSIDSLVQSIDGNVVAQIFSQSGYGGYLEIGTRKMKAQPYLYPAFNQFVPRLSEIIGTRVKSIRPRMFVGPQRTPGKG